MLIRLSFQQLSINLPTIKHVVLVDGHHLMYRAYWAIPRTFRTRAGEQSNAVFGMASMLLTIMKQEEPDAMVLCFDEGDQTFRHQENETYKDGRAETPDDFYTQIPRIFQLVDAWGLLHLSNPQYEADDFIASYARAAEKEGTQVTIVTGDKDLFQLVSDKIRVAIPHKGYQQAEYMGPQQVIDKYSIRPDQVAAWKGLAGDSSDNLPGVVGIGPKTAATLLEKYNTLEGIYEHINEVRPAVAEKLERDKEQAFFCERMAELVTDIELPYPLEDIMLHDLPAGTLFDFFTEMEFTLLTKRFQTFLQSEYGQNIFMGGEDVSTSTQTSEREQLSMF